MNIIDNLDKINNVDELLSKQDLVDELANRISFLKLLEKNMEYFVAEDPAQYSNISIFLLLREKENIMIPAMRLQRKKPSSIMNLMRLMKMRFLKTDLKKKPFLITS